ncbi:Gfo/Idh/MocA family protein [Ruania halotolerans]|uniref:Gfo/Idh/MocA family protein n=1 Tax=Ruania halotolerans TaxID=2897773 RepID=UPI001E38BEA5|nr:Gfo/Idh/MocA family oxidoreductase [Ruania halotolerans]UFU08035.1 Gfo/Idh/MocA family oxidoreductase [Ruania halotolerans]
MSQQVRVGIIGYGAQGSTYARMLAEGSIAGATLGAVADHDHARRSLVAEEHPGTPLFEEYLDLLGSGAVDAVVTTVPHYLHPEVAIAALEAGLHVLVEKPAGVYTAQVRELNEFAATKPDLTFAIMFNQRTNPLYRKIKEIVDAGEIGAIRRSNWIITTWWRPQGYYEQSAWRATWGGEGGGVLVNQAPHQLDLWQWICGVPKSVVAKAGFGFRRDIAVEDEVTALVDYGDGATGVFITATHDLVGTDRFEILGDKGKIVVEGSATATVTRLVKDEREISDGVPAEDVRKMFRGELGLAEMQETETLSFDSAWGSQHGEVLRNFAANIRGEEPLLAPGSDGMNGVRLANAIHLSAWLGREVPLDFDESQYLEELNARIRAEGKFPERAG